MELGKVFFCVCVHNNNVHVPVSSFFLSLLYHPTITPFKYSHMWAWSFWKFLPLFLLQQSLFLPLVSFVGQDLRCCQAPRDNLDCDRCCVNTVRSNGRFVWCPSKQKISNNNDNRKTSSAKQLWPKIEKMVRGKLQENGARCSKSLKVEVWVADRGRQSNPGLYKNYLPAAGCEWRARYAKRCRWTCRWQALPGPQKRLSPGWWPATRRRSSAKGWRSRLTCRCAAWGHCAAACGRRAWSRRCCSGSASATGRSRRTRCPWRSPLTLLYLSEEMGDHQMIS